MRKFWIAALSISLVLLLAGASWAGGWSVKQEGNGLLHEGQQPGVQEVDLGWNLKLSADGTYVRGNVNIVEKLGDGEIRHFQFKGGQVSELKDATFNCQTDEVRVEGDGIWKISGEEDKVVHFAIHLRGTNNVGNPMSVWYWVKDAGQIVTNSGARLTLDSEPFTTTCPPE